MHLLINEAFTIPTRLPTVQVGGIYMEQHVND